MVGHAVTAALLLCLVPALSAQYRAIGGIAIGDKDRIDIEDNCRNTRWGCCPDGKKAALGPENLGCYTCADNPCKGDNMLCRDNSKYILGYTCYCADGYKLVNGICVSESVGYGDCSGIDCTAEKNRVCIEKKDGKSCYCLPGFEFGQDMCMEGEGACAGKTCGSGSTCYNSANNPEDYKCCCDPGYEEEIVIVGNGTEKTICVLQDCSKTRFGCCQDGFTPAEGENFLGCPVSWDDSKREIKKLDDDEKKKKSVKIINRLAKSDKKIEKKMGSIVKKPRDCCTKERYYDCNLQKATLGCRYRFVPGHGYSLCCPQKPTIVGQGCDCIKCIVPVAESPNIPWYKEPCFRFGICRPQLYVMNKIPHFCIRINPMPMMWYQANIQVSWPSNCQCIAKKPISIEEAKCNMLAKADANPIRRTII